MENKNLKKSITNIVLAGAEIKAAAAKIARASNDPVVKLAMDQIEDHIINMRGDFKNVLEYGKQQLERQNRS